MSKILVTGFEPFGGESINPSWEAVRRLPASINGAELILREIPVEYDLGAKTLNALLDEFSPDAAVLCGQAGGRRGVTVEVCAINRDHAEAPDNAGDKRLYAPIDPEGDAAYFTKCDVQNIVENVRAAGLECSPSFSAGAYVCNHLYYTLLSRAAREGAPRRGLFIHVPFIPAQTTGRNVAAPSMPIEEIAAAIETAVRTVSEELARP